MLFFLFLLIIISALGGSYYFTNKMSAQRKQILLLKYQTNNLKQASKSSKDKTITIKYILPICNQGIIAKKCELFLSPMENSLILNSLNESTLVEIQDSVSIDNELWYEVSLIAKERVNSKGWIKEEFLKLLEDIDK